MQQMSQTESPSHWNFLLCKTVTFWFLVNDCYRAEKEKVNVTQLSIHFLLLGGLGRGGSTLSGAQNSLSSATSSSSSGWACSSAQPCTEAFVNVFEENWLFSSQSVPFILLVVSFLDEHVMLFSLCFCSSFPSSHLQHVAVILGSCRLAWTAWRRPAATSALALTLVILSGDWPSCVWQPADILGSKSFIWNVWTADSES